MRKLFCFLCLTAISVSAMAQGTVMFANGPTTLLSYSYFPGAPQAVALGPAPVGSYFYGLLISTSATGPFTFSGVYATNTATGSKLGPATYTPEVPGWRGGTTMFFEVAGWSSNLGVTWNNAWLVNNEPAPLGSPVWAAAGLFGLSGIASGAATDWPAPPFPLFGGTGVSGFALYGSTIPEPSIAALSSLGLCAWLISRWRNWRIPGPLKSPNSASSSLPRSGYYARGPHGRAAGRVQP